MPKSKKDMPQNLMNVDTDEVPDLTGPEWEDAFAKSKIQRGRPKAFNPKVSTTIRFDADVLEYFKSSGAGWQSRMNAALRREAGLE
ncbi:MAG: hypothetical protein ACJAVO_001982 [Parvibaculaceae bacterium]|jgi:uncharacterized protein (DUF4415 family)